MMLVDYCFYLFYFNSTFVMAIRTLVYSCFQSKVDFNSAYFGMFRVQAQI